MKLSPAQIQLHVLSRPNFDMEEFEKFLDQEMPRSGDVGSKQWQFSKDASPAELLVEAAGRVCYMSFGEHQHTKKTAKYLSNLITNRHESVLEHASWTFILVGVSRAFTHQLVRHRVGFAFSQLSQQYHDETEAQFVRPKLIERLAREQTELADAMDAAWSNAITGAKNTYAELMQLLEKLDSQEIDFLTKREIQRAIRSVARSVLPNATETKIVVTANARALRHFLEVRGAISGDEEMRVVSSLMLQMALEDAPSLFGDFSIEHFADGTPTVVKIST